MMKKVYVTRILPPQAMSALNALASSGKIKFETWQGALPPPKDVLLEKVRGCDGVISLLTDPVDDDFFKAAGPQLRVVSNMAVGYNNIDTKAAADRNVRVGHTPGVLTSAVVDMAFALLMSIARRIPEAYDYARAGKWKTWEPLGFVGLDLQGMTLGIVGMGRIGYLFAKKCVAGWGMKVVYYDKYKNDRADQDLGAKRVDTLEELLGASDIVSIHCLLTPETKHLMSEKEFKMMKPRSVLINTARGPIVDQQALIQACKENRIFGAAIDVTNPEPAKADDEILHVPNIVVAPHIASATLDTRNAMGMISVNNLMAGMEGNALQHEVPETFNVLDKLPKKPFSKL